MRITFASCVLISSLLTSNLSAEEGYGTITGQFVLRGKTPILKPMMKNGIVIPNESLVVDNKTKGIANLFVYLRRKPANIHPKLAPIPASAVVLDIQGFRYVPRNAIIRVGQKTLLKSNDNVRHNAHLYPLVNDAWNYLLAPKERVGIDVTQTFHQKEILPIKMASDCCPWMRGYLLVIDHPYAANTNTQGKFTIKDLPAGVHEVRVWHESAGYVERSLTVTVEPGKTTNLGEIKVDVKRFELN